MDYRVLGRTGVLVSELCFGTMSFGNEADEQEAARMFHRCRDVGVNCFDCANNYSHGKAEEILGKLIKECRNDVIISTKFSHRTGKDVNAIGSSRRHIMLTVEESLSRLQTNRIDLYFVHQFDPLTAIDETLRALDDLVRQGKVLYLGASNWAAWQIAKALGISGKDGLARFECIQPMYNLVKRQAEVELLPLAAAENLGVIPYSPLGAGLLSGKYSKEQTPKRGRIVEKGRYNKRYSDPRYYEVAEQFCAYAKTIGIPPVPLAIRWVLSHPAVTAPIIGARNVRQLEDSLSAIDVDMDSTMRDEISKLSIQPPPATDRLEEILDPNYTIRKK